MAHGGGPPVPAQAPAEGGRPSRATAGRARWGSRAATVAQRAATATESATLRHEALLHAGDDAFAEAVAPFVREGLEAGEPVIALLRAGHLDLLREALGDDRDEVVLADVSELGRNPARLIPAWRRCIAGLGDAGRRVRGIGEAAWPGRDRDEIEECARHEALLNHAFADHHLWLVCAYDTEALADEVLDGVHRHHPLVTAGGRSRPSAAFVSDPGAVLAGALPEAPADALVEPVSREAIPDARGLVRAQARRAGFSPARCEDIALAVSELATNSVRHGGGRGELRVWIEADALTCEVRDDGRITEPMIGRVQPDPAQLGGHGLWLTNQVCDLLQIRSGPAGTTVRARIRRTA